MLRPYPDQDPSSSRDGAACLDEDEVLAFAIESTGDAARRARVERHLDICPRCLELVARVVRDSRCEQDEDRSGSVLITTLQPGSMIAERYAIRRFVARGGMGEVYEALDTKLEERVALKTVVSTNGDSARAVRKLFAEVQLARRIQHPHVCRIHELHEHRDANGRRASLHFLTMEFIDGERLGQRIQRRGALGVDEACHIAGQLLEGLEAAHAARVLHLDFKTDNVMLREGSTPPHAVIMDFGLSRAVDAEARLRTSEQKELVGSMAYMSPEQVECRRSLGTETDIYAFGVVLFEMLTGRLPFDGDTPVAVMLKRLHERPTAPSRFVPDLPERLNQFVLRCLSRDLHVRFRDARSARLAFERALAPDPPRAPARGSTRLLPGAAAGLLVALGIAAHLRAGADAAPGARQPEPSPLPVHALPAKSVEALLPAGPSRRAVAPAAPAPRAPVERKATAAEQPATRATPAAQRGKPRARPPVGARPAPAHGASQRGRRAPLPGVPRRLLGPDE